MMHYCDKCRSVRGFPKSTKSENSVQCDFCAVVIGKLYKGTYAALVGLDRNPDMYETYKGSIRVHQMVSLPDNLPINQIHKKEKKKSLNDKFIITFMATQAEDQSTTIFVTNRHTGEQICVQM